MDYAFTPRGWKDLRRFDIPTQRKIIQKIKFYLRSSQPLSFAKILANSPYGTHRFRILGKTRVIFIYEPREKRIVIARIRFRRDAY